MRICRHCKAAPATGERGPAVCADCAVRARRETTAARNRRWRATRRTVPLRAAQFLSPEGGLPTVCWCENEVGYLSPEEVRAGTGVSCGRPDCRPVAA